MKRFIHRARFIILPLTCLITISSCTNSTAPKDQPISSSQNNKRTRVVSVEHGKASWYSIKTNRGTRTASGQRLENNAATAAHKTLPFGTKVRVTNLLNNKSEIVTITDRGPYTRGRIIDVTIGTAEKLNFVRTGVIPTKVEVLKDIPRKVKRFAAH